MKKTAILAFAAVLLVSCNSDEPKQALADSDLSGYTLSLESHPIKELSARCARDNELQFSGDKTFKLIESGTTRSCTDDKAELSTTEHEVIASGTWDFDPNKKELTATVKTIAKYALPFAKQLGDAFVITDLKKDEAGEIYGKIDKLYDETEACLAVNAGENTKETNGTELHFKPTANDQVEILLTANDLKTPDGASYVASFKDENGKGIDLTAKYAADNLLTFLPNSKNLLYVEAGAARTLCSPNSQSTEKGEHLVHAGKSGNTAALTWDVDKKGDLTVKVPVGNEVKYLIPFSLVDATPTTQAASFTIKGCTLKGDKITGKIDKIYDAKLADASRVACTDLRIPGTVTAKQDITVSLTKKDYDHGAYVERYEKKNILYGKLFVLKDKDVKTKDGDLSINVYLRDNKLTITKGVGADKDTWTYTEGARAYAPKDASFNRSYDCSKAGAITEAGSLLAKGTATLTEEADDIKVVLSLEQVSPPSTPRKTGQPSSHPYWVPFSNLDPKTNTGNVTLRFSREMGLNKDGSINNVEVKMDYYEPAASGSGQCTKSTGGEAVSLVGEATTPGTGPGSTLRREVTLTFMQSKP